MAVARFQQGEAHENRPRRPRRRDLLRLCRNSLRRPAADGGRLPGPATPFVVPAGGHETLSANAFGGSGIDIPPAGRSLFAPPGSAPRGPVLSARDSVPDR